MEQFDINTVVGVVIATLVSAAFRWLKKRLFWKRVTERAKDYLDDPAVPIDTPQAAAERALNDQQSDRIRQVAQSISPPLSIGRTPTKRGIKPPDG